ncbi:hypothetical protein CEP14_05075 [Cylindrospermopsis raciborskii C04]|uniref:Uncharacterized protein n=1 Tax=Cylindrospermopsis raciborskii C07 TaxID=2014886 RepID=A0ABX4WPC6_9CYAN|nr:hypothetical protein CEP13_04330 [Cylindrospermopsis raciborskii C03]PNJ97985.1 hypothetical protein CEP14_05075 [Cylindrospermopsis raciborskii C04]PNJ99978.1 hypothetical protein CEP15_05350 [Cylindrospermopsis raciborskii C07]PNK13060.1 hypothetical protein CEP07_17880 [Cylindrospermopsis raciborskii S01]
MGGIDMVRQIPPKTQLGVIKCDVHQGAKTPEIVYPESDGQPMADNTRQFTWIVKVNRPTHKGMGFYARSINYYLHDSLPFGGFELS